MPRGLIVLPVILLIMMQLTGMEQEKDFLRENGSKEPSLEFRADGIGSILCVFVDKVLKNEKTIAELYDFLKMHAGSISEADKLALDVVHAAAMKGRTDVIEALMVYGFPIDSPSEDRVFSPLYYSLAKGQSIKTVAFLLDHDADVSSRDLYGIQPIHYAALRCNPEAINLFVTRGADPEARVVGKKVSTKMGGFTPLHVIGTIRGERQDTCIRKLLEYGVYIDSVTPDGSTALQLTLQSKNFAAQKLLAQYGGRMDLIGPDFVENESDYEIDSEFYLLSCLEELDEISVSTIPSMREANPRKLIALTRFFREVSSSALLRIASGQGQELIVDRILRDPPSHLAMSDFLHSFIGASAGGHAYIVNGLWHHLVDSRVSHTVLALAGSQALTISAGQRNILVFALLLDHGVPVGDTARHLMILTNHPAYGGNRGVLYQGLFDALCDIQRLRIALGRYVYFAHLGVTSRNAEPHYDDDVSEDFPLLLRRLPIPLIDNIFMRVRREPSFFWRAIPSVCTRLIIMIIFNHLPTSLAV